MKLVKLAGALAVVVFVIFMVVSVGQGPVPTPKPPQILETPPDHGCKSVCVKAIYTCKQGLRVNMRVETVNATNTPINVVSYQIATRGEDGRQRIESYPTELPAHFRLYFEQDAVPDITFTYQVNVGFKKLGTGMLGPNDPCQPGDIPA